MTRGDHLTDLSKLARAATRGGWIAVGTWVENTRDDLPDIVVQPASEDRGPNDDEKRREADARFIAAANPSRVLELIAEIRELRRLLSL